MVRITQLETEWCLTEQSHSTLKFYWYSVVLDHAYCQQLQSAADETFSQSAADALVFIEPRTAKFKYRGHGIERTGFPISHGKIITSTACQGRTMHAELAC